MTQLLLAGAAMAALFTVGCAGPEQKFGRGMANATEFTRLGEISRSMEQASLFDSPEGGLTTGLFRGINRSLARTGVGVYEMVTAPFPNHRNKDYGPIYKPAGVLYPDSYRPGPVAATFLSSDASIGFGNGDIAPIVPGSRFRIFEP